MHGTDSYQRLQQALTRQPITWLVTGAAGFIGYHLAHKLLGLGQRVVAVDNFSTGSRRNVKALQNRGGDFQFLHGDIRSLAFCRRAVSGVDIVLHQAALGSVPRSLRDPIQANDVNVGGFLNILVASQEAGIRRVVYAASSSTYGDHEGLPKREDHIGRPLSPYAVTKYVNELYAEVFARCYEQASIGLRYFNVFGPRQDPEGAYAAVIPRWFGRLARGEPCQIYGDGTTSRDFCYIDNVVQANLLAATTENPEAVNQVYNIAFGQRTTLTQLYEQIRALVGERDPDVLDMAPEHQGFRSGDVQHSLADISKAQRLLHYRPVWDLRCGLAETAEWFLDSTREVQIQ